MHRAKFLHPEKRYFKNKDKGMSFSDRENLKQCISLRNMWKPSEQKKMILDCNLDIQKVKSYENSS